MYAESRGKMRAYVNDTRIGFTVLVDDEEWIIEKYLPGLVQLRNAALDEVRWIPDDMASYWPVQVIRL